MAFSFPIMLLSSMLPSALASPPTDSTPQAHERFKFNWGMDERFRQEYIHNFDFSRSLKDNGIQLYHRFRLNFKSTLVDDEGQEAAELFIEGLDAQTGGYRVKANAGQVDDFDLHQAYLLVPHLAGSKVDLKIGRQELNYGQGRLLAAPAFNNRMRHFDAVILRAKINSFYGDLLFGQDVKFDDNNFNRSLDEESIGGIYAGFKDEHASFLGEGYFLTQIVTSTSTTTRRYTLGPHLQAAWAKFNFDFELPYQFGETGLKDIRAYGVHVDVSRKFDQVKWKPKFTGEYNHATGDKDPNDSVSNTFIPLYQSTHSPYGIMDFFKWQNMREFAFHIQLSPTQKLKIVPQTNFFWLDSKADSWYSASGTVLRTKTSGDRNYFVGQEISLQVNYDFNKHLKFETGIATFLTGGYVADTGANDNANWMYSQVILKY